MTLFRILTFLGITNLSDRQVIEIEQALFFRKYQEAREKLEPILSNDPLNQNSDTPIGYSGSNERDLYHEELSFVRKYKSKLEGSVAVMEPIVADIVKSHSIYKEDLEMIANQYEELVAQAKVITRVSDRLQKKLDNANQRIKELNLEIARLKKKCPD